MVLVYEMKTEAGDVVYFMRVGFGALPRLMDPRNVLNRRVLAPVGWILIVVILAISPRSILAPTHAVTRAAESKRPKAPKNVVRAESNHASNIDRMVKAARPAPSTAAPHELHDLRARTTLAPQVPAGAILELTKPDYLKPAQGSPPTNRLAPPV